MSVQREGHLDNRIDSLISRLKAGDCDVAREMVDLYYEQIYSFMVRLGHGREVGEDLTHEIFLEAWRHLGELRNPQAFNSWIYRIAGNVSKGYWRKHKWAGLANIDDIEIAEGGANAGEKTENIEQFQILQESIWQLPIKLRNAVVLHYLQDLTIAEAAEAEGVFDGTFKSRLSRALKMLRKQALGKSVKL